MTTADLQLNEKQQNVVKGTLTQAKGVVREQWGNLANNDFTRLSGKKDQVVGHIQANYGNSWPMRHRGWMLIGTAVALIGAALVFIFTRDNTQAESVS